MADTKKKRKPEVTSKRKPDVDKTKKKKPVVKPKPKIIKERVIKPLFEANIAEKGYTSYFKLKVYKDTKTLNKAINDLRRKESTGKAFAGDDVDTDYAGIVFEEILLKEEMTENHDQPVCQFATCLLSAEDLSYSTIAHEALHLALVNERLLKRYVGGYTEEPKFGNIPEERLAYCVESYVSAIIMTCKSQNLVIVNE